MDTFTWWYAARQTGWGFFKPIRDGSLLVLELSGANFNDPIQCKNGFGMFWPWFSSAYTQAGRRTTCFDALGWYTLGQQVSSLDALSPTKQPTNWPTNWPINRPTDHNRPKNLMTFGAMRLRHISWSKALATDHQRRDSDRKSWVPEVRLERNVQI